MRDAYNRCVREDSDSSTCIPIKWFIQLISAAMIIIRKMALPGCRMRESVMQIRIANTVILLTTILRKSVLSARAQRYPVPSVRHLDAVIVRVGILITESD